VVNVFTPTVPIEVGSYISGTFTADRVVVSGDYAYVLGGDLTVIDVSDPTAPGYISSYNISWTPTDIAVAGDYAYIGWYGCVPSMPCNFGGLEIVNVSDPYAPTEVHNYTDYTASGPVVAAAAVGSYAYLGIGLTFVPALEVVNISDVENPIEGSVQYLAGDVFRLTGAGSYLYVAAGSGGLQIMILPRFGGQGVKERSALAGSGVAHRPPG